MKPEYIILKNKYGANPINGNINPQKEMEPPKPLEVGTYYIAIWGWDDKGTSIVSSSIISYFKIWEQ